MKRKILLVFLFIFISNFANSQVIDNYRVNFGITISSQVWDYKLIRSNSSYIRYKSGIQSFFQAEKELGRILALRTELGYIQKGFKNNIQFTFADGTIADSKKENVVFHNLALGFGYIIKPRKTDFFPYFLVGIRGDYLISYKDIILIEPTSGKKFQIYDSILMNYNRFNCGGVIGIGIDIEDFIYFEVEYNPNFAENYNTTELSI